MCEKNNFPVRNRRYAFKARVLVGALLLFHLVCDAVWWRAAEYPPSWDFAHHHAKALAYSDLISAHDWLGLLDADEYYPPLSRLPAALAHLIFGRDDDVALAANYVWFVLLVLAVYGLGRRYGGARAGAAGAFFTAFTPFIYNYTRCYAVDLPTTAAVAVAFWAVARAGRFGRLGPSLVFGLVFGLALLVKWTAAIFILPTAVAAALVPDRSSGRGGRVAALVLSLSAAAFVAGPWYARHLVHLVAAARHTAAEAIAQGDPPVWSGASFVYYVRAAVYQMGFLMLAAGLGAVMYVIARGRPGWRLVAIWLLVPWVAFTLLRNKDFRFTMPVLPAFALAAGIAYAQIKRRRVAVIGAAVAVLYTLTLFFIITFKIPGTPQTFYLRPFGMRLMVYDAERPVREDWHLRDILARVRPIRGAARPNLCVIPNAATFAPVTFGYYAKRDLLPVNVYRPRGESPWFADYLVVKTGDQGDEGARRANEELTREAETFNRIYTAVARYRLPDGSSAALYRRFVRRKPNASPLTARAAAVLLRSFGKDLITAAEGVAVYAVERDVTTGDYEKLSVTASYAVLAGVPVRDLNLHLTDAVLNPWAPEDETQLLAVGRVEGDCVADAGAVGRHLEETLPGFTCSDVRWEINGVAVAGKWYRIPLAVRVGLDDSGRRVAVKLRECRVFGFRVPSLISDYLNAQIAPLAYRDRLPFLIGDVGLQPRGTSEAILKVGGFDKPAE